jgi:hypothetical protein
LLEAANNAIEAAVVDWTARAEEATHFLTGTDKKMAELKVKLERDKRKAKRIWSALYMRVEGNVEARKAQAEIHPDHESAIAAEMTALLEFEKLRNQRDTAETVIEFWRSWNRAAGGTL